MNSIFPESIPSSTICDVSTKGDLSIIDQKLKCFPILKKNKFGWLMIINPFLELLIISFFSESSATNSIVLNKYFF